jgi:hypothetical protein
MKLRIRGNSVRLRLTRTEVAALAATGIVEESTEFLGSETFVYAVSASESADVSANFVDGRINVAIPADKVAAWASGDEVGIAAECGLLKVLVEKDFNCLTPRDADEDADTFPHPKSDGEC